MMWLKGDTDRVNTTTTADRSQRRRDARAAEPVASGSSRATWRLEGDERDQVDQLISLVSQRLRSDRRAVEIARRRDNRRTWTWTVVGVAFAALLAGVALGGWRLADATANGPGTTVLTVTLAAFALLGLLVLAFSIYSFIMQRVVARHLREAHDNARDAEHAVLIQQALTAARKALDDAHGDR